MTFTMLLRLCVTLLLLWWNENRVKKNGENIKAIIVAQWKTHGKHWSDQTLHHTLLLLYKYKHTPKTTRRFRQRDKFFQCGKKNCMKIVEKAIYPHRYRNGKYIRFLLHVHWVVRFMFMHKICINVISFSLVGCLWGLIDRSLARLLVMQ